MVLKLAMNALPLEPEPEELLWWLTVEAAEAYRMIVVHDALETILEHDLNAVNVVHT